MSAVSWSSAFRVLELRVQGCLPEPQKYIGINPGANEKHVLSFSERLVDLDSKMQILLHDQGLEFRDSGCRGLGIWGLGV